MHLQASTYLGWQGFAYRQFNLTERERFRWSSGSSGFSQPEFEKHAECTIFHGKSRHCLQDKTHRNLTVVSPTEPDLAAGSGRLLVSVSAV